ncbi:serine/threonine-protein kinase MARK1-like [Haliotis asinina]|uniref:serine/threonine-protein kinase MARK1-like n=1 Tax=Haliotis asinina TaxID=109174 RepID=UPI003531BB1C
MENSWFLKEILCPTEELDIGTPLTSTLRIESQHNVAAELWRKHLCSDNKRPENIESVPSFITRVDVSTPAPSAWRKPPKCEDTLLGQTIRGYRFQYVIESGGTAIVYKVTKDGRTYAAKVSRRNSFNQETITKAWATEFRIMSHLRHKNIIQAYDLFTHRGLQVMIMEYFYGCDLADFIAWNNISQRHRALKKISRQILKAIKYVHQEDIVHRDLKPGNILIGKDLKVKIIDFGGAMKLSPEDTLQDRKPTISTPQYTPPEVHAGERRSASDICMKAFDMWSIGVTLYESSTRKMPFLGNPSFGRNSSLTLSDFSVLERRDRRLHSLVTKCLDMNPESRITAKTALKQKYFRRFFI